MYTSDDLINGNVFRKKLQLLEKKSGIYVQRLSELRVLLYEDMSKCVPIFCEESQEGALRVKIKVARKHLYGLPISRSTQGDLGECGVVNNGCEDDNNGLRGNNLNG
uniref:AlNc14C220G9097 protein n=1 Tax=Albugo laibachii Nc14 TaxID=890382 RepID=F0WRV2_9STRA|nr:AlNc14C220G9097 [Albugo laibachii Nc14]|eukprot:CCA24068.1 AlNc14C220G9097 [Albugo laibachii Nc14]